MSSTSNVAATAITPSEKDSSRPVLTLVVSAGAAMVLPGPSSRVHRALATHIRFFGSS
jgi:hypothetical protein